MRTIDLQTQIKFERILLATDFSAGAEMAQAYAVGLALQDGSTLQLTTVVTLPSLDAISECALDSVRHSSEEDLHRLANDIPKVKVTRKVIEGFQRAGAIVDEGSRSCADLIVLGTASKHGLKKLALGSTAEEVVRTAGCPVLTVGPRVAAPPHGPLTFHSIVYATDFSAQAAKGVRLACRRHEGVSVPRGCGPRGNERRAGGSKVPRIVEGTHPRIREVQLRTRVSGRTRQGVGSDSASCQASPCRSHRAGRQKGVLLA